MSHTELKKEGNITTVLPDATVAIRTHKLNTDTMATKLYVRNPGTEPAEYKVWIVE